MRYRTVPRPPGRLNKTGNDVEISTYSGIPVETGDGSVSQLKPNCDKADFTGGTQKPSPVVKAGAFYFLLPIAYCLLPLPDRLQFTLMMNSNLHSK